MEEYQTKVQQEIQLPFGTNTKPLFHLHDKERKSGFFNLSKAECSALYPEILSNARAHFDLAKDVFRSKNYGFAIAHTVLASEELVKALLVFGETLDLEIRKIPGVKKYFANHKVRHDLANHVYLVLCFLMPFSDAVKDEQLIEWNEDGSVKYAWCLENRMRYLRALVPLRKGFAWWQNADYFKQTGFYVDYGDRVIKPSDITLKDCKNGLDVTERSFDMATQLIDQVEKMSDAEKQKYIKELPRIEILKLIESFVKKEIPVPISRSKRLSRWIKRVFKKD